MCVAGNALEEIPPEIGQLQKLETLDLSANMLHHIPLQILDLPSLRRLNLSGNPILQNDSVLDELCKNKKATLELVVGALA
jgi:Leucine-rich repeat (LRR) protein